MQTDPDVLLSRLTFEEYCLTGQHFKAEESFRELGNLGSTTPIPQVVPQHTPFYDTHHLSQYPMCLDTFLSHLILLSTLLPHPIFLHNSQNSPSS